MKYFLIAGEASGDLHGSNLVSAIRERDPEAGFCGLGGDRMQEAGVDIQIHIKDMAFMGFVEVLLHLGKIFANIRKTKLAIRNYRPDAVILIDYPGFNLRLLPFIHSLGIPIVYYISPQLWAWKAGRVRQIKKYVSRMLVILPFETAFYAQYDYKVDYVGHPLLDEIDGLPEDDSFRTRNGLDARPVVALLPGSRKQELQRSLPVFVRVAQKRKDLQFVIACAPSLELSDYQSFSLPDNVTMVSKQTYSLLQHAEAALVTSGTATLETALFGVPQVVCYRGNRLSYLIARRLVRVKYISLVNLVMDEELVPERIQDQFNAQQLLGDLDNLFRNDKRDAMRAGYRVLKEKLGGEGASARAAGLITGS